MELPAPFDGLVKLEWRNTPGERGKRRPEMKPVNEQVMNPISRQIWNQVRDQDQLWNKLWDPICT